MNGLPTFLDESLQRLFLKELLSTPRGKATLLRQLGDAEGGDGGELDIFTHVLAVLDDPEVKKLVQVHKTDEERHERLFHERAAAAGATPKKLPPDAHLLRRLDHHVGFFSKPVTDRAGVVDAYLLLLVIEERAISTFDRYMDAFKNAGDLETVAVLQQIKADEARHLKYCEAISKRYSDDEAVRQEKLAKYRALEAQCFDEVQAINLRVLVDSGFVGHSWWTRMLWSTLSKAAEDRLPPEMQNGALAPWSARDDAEPTARMAAAA
ncbi:MAG TPA: ferritin-like domain-containing protein [Myxococcota bacterium]